VSRGGPNRRPSRKIMRSCHKKRLGFEFSNGFAVEGISLALVTQGGSSNRGTGEEGQWETGKPRKLFLSAEPSWLKGSAKVW